MREDETYALSIRDLVAGYHKKEVLRGVSVKLRKREVVALVGHNGAGKSTLLKVVAGFLPPWRGLVLINGADTSQRSPSELRRDGVAFVPQGNRVFPGLSVRENLEVAGQITSRSGRASDSIESTLKIFPSLASRVIQPAFTLSGGERQVLALAMGLITSPSLLLLDEPSLGLAPRLVRTALHHIRELAGSTGTSVLVAEQKVKDVLTIADRVCVLRGGSVTFFGNASELNTDSKLREVFL